jgi:hypothetical protein
LSLLFRFHGFPPFIEDRPSGINVHRLAM